MRTAFSAALVLPAFFLNTIAAPAAGTGLRRDVGGLAGIESIVPAISGVTNEVGTVQGRDIGGVNDVLPVPGVTDLVGGIVRKDITGVADTLPVVPGTVDLLGGVVRKDIGGVTNDVPVAPELTGLLSGIVRKDIGGVSDVLPEVTDLVGGVARRGSIVEVSAKVDIGGVTDIVTSLLADVKHLTASINVTLGGISAHASESDKKAAASVLVKDIAAITAAVTVANSKAHFLGQASVDADVDLACLIESLLLEISCTLSSVLAIVDLPGLLASISPLVSALSCLLASLDSIVVGLLAEVTKLLGSLLPGVCLVLKGLVI